MRKTNTLIALVMPLALAGLAGCAGNQQSLRSEHGDALKANTAMQTINPMAGHEDVPVATRDGERTENIIKAYRKDTGKADASRLVTDLSQ
ncbi:MAG: hypothetical protein FNT29_07395 [Halothiobacillaceae bacterium]|nr:MAG: hypothetical protein FNT29_07395 [Halothiobacillaceae bacterium]